MELVHPQFLVIIGALVATTYRYWEKKTKYSESQNLHGISDCAELVPLSLILLKDQL